MRLLGRQDNDGVQSGDTYEIVPLPGLTPEQMLARKEQSHNGRGWTVIRRPDGTVHAFKIYPASERRKDPGVPRRKDRYMWLTD
jgi:hypothetical protein